MLDSGRAAFTWKPASHGPNSKEVICPLLIFLKINLWPIFLLPLLGEWIMVLDLIELINYLGEYSALPSKYKSLFIYLFLAALGLRCWVQAFSSCSEWGLLFVVVHRLLCGGFSCCGARAVGMRASVVVAHGLSSCGLRALEHRLSSCGTWA